MAAASSSNAPVGGESASDEESVCSDDLHSAVSSSGLDSDEEFGVGCESREASESDASGQDDHSAADESANDSADDKDDAADEATLNQCVLCTRPLTWDFGISFTCDGNCGLDFGELERRWTCKARMCEFDVCVRCMTTQKGSALPLLPPAQPVTQATPPPPRPPSHPRLPAEPVGQSRSPLDTATARGVPPPAVPALHAPATATAGLSPNAAPPAFRPVGRGDMPTVAARMDHFETWQRERARERAAATAAPAAPAASAEAPADATTGILRPPLAAAPSDPAAASDPAASDPAASSRPTPTTAPYALQPPPDMVQIALPGAALERQVGALLGAGAESRRRAVAFAREVMRQLPTVDLVAACDDCYGPMSEETYISLGPATPRRPPTSMQVALPESRPELSLLALTYRVRCICCDHEVGEGDGGRCASPAPMRSCSCTDTKAASVLRCAALQMLATLAEDTAERERIIQHELDSDDPPEDLGDLHRAARWFMYRTFVAAQYGYLGKGCRVRIPLCVVAAIRCRFPAPGCDCTPAAIATCHTHGYVGHRDA